MCERIVFKGRTFVLLCLSTKPWKRTALAIAVSSLLHSLTALPQNKLSPVTWIRPVTVLGTDPYKSGLMFYLQKPLNFLRQRPVSLKWQYSGSHTELKLWDFPLESLAPRVQRPQHECNNSFVFIECWGLEDSLTPFPLYAFTLCRHDLLFW